jgi:hypothetical protein
MVKKQCFSFVGMRSDVSSTFEVQRECRSQATPRVGDLAPLGQCRGVVPQIPLTLAAPLGLELECQPANRLQTTRDGNLVIVPAVESNEVAGFVVVQ